MTPISRDELVDLLKNAGYIAYDYNIADQIVRAEGAIEEVCGYTYEEFNSSNVHWWVDQMHPDDRAIANEHHIEMLSQGGPYRGRYRVRRKTGEYVLVRDDGYAFAKDKTTGLSTRMSGLISIVEPNDNKPR